MYNIIGHNIMNSTNATGIPSQTAESTPDLVLVVLACLFSSLWVLFLGFYHSRFSGTFVTYIISKLLISKDAYLKIGSISVSVLSGKLMFRDVLYVTRDLTLRVVDGYAIFHWWQKFTPESEVNADENPSCRLTVSLNGFEFHVYNRSDLYDRLQDIYKKDRYGDAHNSTEDLTENHSKNLAVDDRHGKYQWRDLIPAIKFDINSGKLAFGNKMVETTLCFHFESAVALYKVAKPASFLDQFAHKITCDCKNFRVMLAPSNGYTGNRDDPPRYMGEGFVVLQTQACKLTYLLDEPGIVPEINADNESVTEADPCWNLDVTFIKSTSLSYGPWADRQREQLQKLFFPFDYQEQAVSKTLAPGQRREHSGIDIRFDFKCNSTLDILFSKDQETQAVHLCIGLGSLIRIYQPWRVNEYGYMSSVVAQLYQVEASTSLEFRQFVEAEEVKVTVNMTIPRIWNHTQHWSADISLHKATWYFVFAHKFFFQDLTSDWASKTAPELLTFIPYEWSLNISLKDFEMIWMANEYNWIDCSTIWQENMELAFCGESFDLSFVLSYMSFLPELEEIKFVFQVEQLVGRLNVPESNTLRRGFLSLAKEHDRRLGAHSRSSTSANVDQEGPESADEQAPFTDEDELCGGWRRHTEIRNGWVDVFSTPILSVIITYIYHPIVPGETFESVRERYSSSVNYSPQLPSDLEADVINLEVDANSCAFKLMGMVLKALANIKENYFGAYQMYREFDARSLSKMKRSITSQSDDSDIHRKDVKEVDKLSLRPMEANIRVNLFSIKAELTKHCNADESLAPVLYTERLTFEMHKNYSETRLQLQLTPTTIFTYDGIKRAEPNRYLSQGYIHLTGLQLRGHAMFSGEDRPIECETLEYAWLVELQLGTFYGKITLPQLHVLCNWAELFVFHFLDEENEMKDPTPYQICQHGALQIKCGKQLPSEKDTDECSPTFCPTEDDLKYKLTRVSIEEVDLFLVEAGCSCNIKLSPIRFASCNLHADNAEIGISLFAHNIEISQYVLLLSANKLKNQVGIPQEEACWLEAGSVHLGPVISDVCLGQDKSFKSLCQKQFLEKHDQKNRRLWFLWKAKMRHASHDVRKEGRCGCTGGCNFFGKNANGPRFFRVEKLDAAIQEEEEKIFGSPDGWQNSELGENNDVFLDNSDGGRCIQRHNSWAGRTRSPSHFGKLHSKGSGKYFRLRSETNSASSSGFDENKPNNTQGYGTLPRQLNEKVLGSTTARSVPESFQNLSSKVGDGSGRLKNAESASIEEMQDHLQRFPSDSSFYSCSSGLEKQLAVTRTPSLVSLDSFTSAVETNDQLGFEKCDDFQEQFILLPSVLLSKYRDHLMQMRCSQWLDGEYLTPACSNKRFSLMHNLKAIDQIPRACPKRLKFTPRYSENCNRTLLCRKYVGESGISFAEQVLPKKVERKPGLKEDTTLFESSAGESDKKIGKMDTLRRKRWKTEINNEPFQSTATLQRPSKPTLDEESLKLASSTAIIRIEGYVNLMASPLLVEAIQRYSKSVAEQVKSLHPCTILDKIHVKSLNVSQKKYKMEPLLVDNEIPSKEKENRLNTFLSIPGVNVCFLQAFTREQKVSSVLQSPESSESDLSDTMQANYHPNPSFSLLAVRLDALSGRVIRHSQRNASYAKLMREKQEDATPGPTTPSQHIPQSPCMESEKSEAEKVNSEVAGSFNITQVQLQFSRLCNKSDVENSHTTAIPPKCSKVDFVYSKQNVIQFSKNLDVKSLKREDVVIFVMLESGINTISAKLGNYTVMKKEEKSKPRALTAPQKSGHSRSQSAPAQLLSKIAQGDVIDARPKPFQQTLHENYSEQVLESIVVEKQPGHTFPRLPRDTESSISSSLSSVSQSDSTGDLTGNESEGDDEPESQPLLGRFSGETGRIGKSFNPPKPNSKESQKPRYVLCQQSNGSLHFTCVWFNCASPSSVKPVPETYHLHNNLLTTGIPAVSSWMPGIEKLRETLARLQDYHRDRFYAVTACMMAQGLPEKNKMLSKHNITSKASDESKYLQAGYSSQLIFHLRRHVVGARKHKLITALSDESSIPSKEDLAKGIMALSRQWKCLLGDTDVEFISRPAGLLKRPVVGRGVLTERDRAILMNTENRKSQDFESMGVDVVSFDMQSSSFSPGTQRYSASDRPSNHPSNQPSSSLSSVSTSDSENVPLSSEARVKRKKASSSKRDTEQSLYSWFSSPVASPMSSDQDASLLDNQEHAVSTVTWAKNVKEDDDLFGQMVSQPTSGKQIADEKIIFKAFFLGMGFLQPSEEFSACSDKTFSLLVKLRCLRLDISGGSLDCLRKKKAKVEIPTIITNDTQSNVPSFYFQNFETKINVRNSPASKSSSNCSDNSAHVKDKLSVDTTVSGTSNAFRLRSVFVKIRCHSATQSINLSLMRLLLQVADMIDILGENYQGIKSAKDSRSGILNHANSGDDGVKPTSENQKCWRIMHQVSDLYSALPSRYSTLKGNGEDRLRDCKVDIDNTSSPIKRRQLSRTLSSPKDIRFVFNKQSRGPPKFKVVSVLTLHKLKCITTLGELRLQTDINNVNFCACHKIEEHQGTLMKRSSAETCFRRVVTTSVSSHLQKASLVLTETGYQGGTVVSCVLNTSHGMYSSIKKRDDEKRSILISLGVIDVDIPQHPVALHCMMTRSSKTLSKQLSEIQSQRSVVRTFSSLERSSLVEISRGGNGLLADGNISSQQILKNGVDATDSGWTNMQENYPNNIDSDLPNMSVTVVLKGFSVGASLLPSLKVEYKIGAVSCFGKTGKENVFKLDMPEHHLSFTSKVKSFDSTIPSSTSILLPRVDISGTLERIRIDASSQIKNVGGQKRKNHLTIVADIGTFNQNLSTDLLNHLIFIQKGFMKEVNDVLQRVSGESQPVPLWRSASSDNLDEGGKCAFLIFTFTLNLKGIQITATTPSSTAVRLETGAVNLGLSNCEPLVRKQISNEEIVDEGKSRVSIKADVDLTLSLGQFLKDPTLEVIDFQQLAFFKTQVRLSNSLQDKETSEEKETLLISVFKPFIYVQPVAFDRAVLLYLNYKNAYSYWNEQRMSLTEDVQSATQAVFEKLPQPHPTAQLSGFLFLQLTVSELGICLPLYNVNQEQPQITVHGPGEVSSALVLTMEKMLLTCCSSASFVSKGNFAQFCVRFSDKFDVKKNDWKPEQTEGFLMNSCMVPNGTYEICSRTIREPYANDVTKAGKMVMSLMWKMCGIDVHCDTEIGKRLKVLGQTLTTVTGDNDIANLDSVAEEPEQQQGEEEEYVVDKDTDDDDADDADDECFDETDYKVKEQNEHTPENLEKEMWKQARKVNELRRRPEVDLKHLQSETEILQDLESAVFNEFRRDVKRKFEKQSRRPLFSRSEISRPSKFKRVKKNSSSIRKQLLSQNISNNDIDEVDFGDSNKIVNLTPLMNRHSPVTSRSLKTSTTGMPQEKELKELQTFSPNLQDAVANTLSPYMKRDSLSLKEIGQQEHVQQRLTNGHASSFYSQRSTVVEQDLDFDLDVTVNIESGKCVFHPTNEAKIDTPESRPVGMRHHDPLKASTSVGQRTRPRAGIKQQDELSDSSVILLPGAEARVHYSSVTNSDYSASFASVSTAESVTVTGVQSPQSPNSDSTISSGRSGKSGKHASLYVSLLVQPLPKEMLLRPAILDFIDQALNPIVALSDTDSATADVRSIHGECEVDPTASSFVSSSTSEHSSFPVDIVVVARIQPSNIRISCLPASRVECLMRIPSLDLAYSSKPSPNKGSNKGCFRSQTSLQDFLGTPRLSSFDSGTTRSYDSGGISFTICLSRFSLFIYHPYGKQHSVSKTTSAPEDSDNFSPKAKVKVPQQQLISGKKDALSLSLEFIKFNLSRRRFGDVLTTNVRKDQQGSQDEISVESSTLVNVSGICDIGSATFTYDMRRLQEILDFPRCWHRRGLFSRLFLGKEGTYATKAATVPVPVPDIIDGVIPLSPSVEISPKKPTVKPLNIGVSGHRRNISTPIPGILPFFSSPSLFGTSSHSTATNTVGNSKSKFCRQSGDRTLDYDEVDSPPSSSSALNAASPVAKWETVVVLAISLSRLDVSTNMANVMGKTVWSTSDLRAFGNLRITNAGERTLRSRLSVRQSTWESRGGIAGGHVELQDISSCVNVCERLGSEPEHSGNIRFRYCESRIDYMGTCILMGNISAFRISMADEWKTNIVKSPSKDDLFKDNTSDTGPTKATVLLCGNLHWKNVRLVICRSTTSDLIKMAKKIEEFFTQQANSSVMMLSSYSQQPVSGDAVSYLSNPLSQPAAEKNEKDPNKDGLKYQHWSKVLSTISNLKSDVLSCALPEKGSVVGGSLELTGCDVLLACFHGLNFRSQTWALFSISQPSATFSSKVGSVEKSCQVHRARSIQKLSFQLGNRCPSPKSSDPQETVHMGVICKVQRGGRNPPSMGSSVSEWLSYVSSVSDIPRQSGDSSPPPRPKCDSEAPTISRRRNKSVSGAHRYEHESDAIFGLPSFKVDFITEHDQPIRVYVSSGDKSSPSFPATPSSPHIVECSLESYFYDSLYVTMDVGLLFFLHEIIQAYVKENESAATKSLTAGPHPKDEHDAVNVTSDGETTTSVGQRKKIRQFRSKSWKLEPTVRFLSWAGRRVEAVNIDWVLEKLGFSHARLTIPKWIQRGAMDPMDKFISVLLHRLLLAIQENKRK